MFGFSFGIDLVFFAVFEVDSDVFVLPYSVISRGTRRLCIRELALFTGKACSILSFVFACVCLSVGNKAKSNKNFYFLSLAVKI